VDPVSSAWLDKGTLGLVILMLLGALGVVWTRMGEKEKRISDLQDARVADAREQTRQLYDATATLKTAMDLIKAGRPS
jgi:hypothetical protein